MIFGHRKVTLYKEAFGLEDGGGPLSVDRLRLRLRLINAGHESETVYPVFSLTEFMEVIFACASTPTLFLIVREIVVGV